MNSETSTTLRFVGDWPWWAGGGGALLLGAVAWALYRREVSTLSWWLRGTLPALRALAVGLMVLMLSGPVLRHRTVIGQLSRLLIFVDGSKSMELTDPSMDPGRKIRILERLGLLQEGVVPMQLPKATEALTAAQGVAERAKGVINADTSEWNGVLTDYASKLKEAHDALAQAGDLGVGRIESFSKDLVEPARELASREMREKNDRERAIRDMERLGNAVERWRSEIAAMFTKNVQGAEEGDASPVKHALQKFDTLPRWQRLQMLLMNESQGNLLATLAKNHAVELFVLEGGTARKIWQPSGRDAAAPAGLPKPTAALTDLADGLKTMIGNGPSQEQRGAMVLLSDGQHNTGESPVEVAKVFAGRQMPIHTVGFGSQSRPPDLAILKVDGPASVFSGDRMRGAITLKDDMPAGLPFTVAIKDGDRVLWEQQLTTEGRNRTVGFDFPISELAQAKLSGQRTGVQTSGVPVEVAVSVSEVGGDRYPENNHSSLRVRAVTQRRKILLLDGRPRWETRYLRNMFERDEQWEINTVIASSFARELGLARGEKAEQFPTDFAALSTYDLILFGEVPRAMLKEEELQWMHDFVAKRGGAIAFIDGSRNYLQGYAGTPVEALLPVEWKGGPILDRITRLTLPERAQALAAFALVPDRAQNLSTWQSLNVPHWLSGASPLPGAEVLVQAEVQAGDSKRFPAVVYRPFGAGKVLYHAFDDSWRWRYEVADQNHVRYWNQVANWIAELPFAVRDKFISLDAGAITYRPGESAEVRVRLRDGEGRPVTDSVVDAVLYREGKRVATLRLAPDENAGGLFRGQTAALEAGAYEVGVESVAIAERDSRARTEFKVESGEMGELTQLALNEDLLKQMAAASGGAYLREEQLPQLLDLLAPMSQGRVIESETVLWQSYWWFLPLIGLLTIEWILRKRAGLL